MVIADVRVAQEENCFPMVPSGAAHNEMILGTDGDDAGPAVSSAGQALV
jgi:acetolactate synthase-1/2/3 large subunit